MRSVLVGVLLMIGGFVIGRGVVAHVLQLDEIRYDFIGFFLGAVLAAAVFSGTLVRSSWREPLVSSILAIAVMYVVMRIELRSWSPITVQHGGWLAVFASAGAMIGSLALGRVVARSRALGAVGLGALVTIGSIVVAAGLALVSPLSLVENLVVSAAVSVFVGSFVAQASTLPGVRWWTGLAGTVALAIWVCVMFGREVEWGMFAALCAIAPIGLLGAWLARRGRASWGHAVLPVLVVIAAAIGCSSKKAEPPTQDPAIAAKPVAKPEPTNTATKAAPAPTSTTPASPTTSIAFMKTLTLGITPGRLDPTTSFAYVDYAEKPQGGYNAIERTICGTTDRAAFDKMIASLSVAPDRIGDDLAEDRVLCTTRGERDYCDVPAREEGDATMTFVISNAHGAPHLVGFGQRSTFMITDEARLARDQARQLEAFEAKLAPACSR